MKQLRALCALRTAVDWTSAIRSGPTIAAWSPLGTRLSCNAAQNLRSFAYSLCFACTTGLNIDLLNFLSLSDFVYGSEAAHGGWRSSHFFLLVLAIGSRSRNM